MEIPRWLTVREAADRAAVGTATIQRWIRDGRLGALELGGARTVYRIHTTDLDELLQQRNQPEVASHPVVQPEFVVQEVVDAVSSLTDRTSEPMPEPRWPERALWQLPFSDLSVPEQVAEATHLVQRWLAADLVIVHIEATGWRLVAGDEPDGVAEIVDGLARQITTEPEPVVSTQCPEHGFGLVATARIADSRHSSGSLSACWTNAIQADEHVSRNLQFAAGVVSNIVRRRSDQWLEMSDVAERCAVNVATVRRWIRQNQLAAIVLGGERAEYRVHTSDLDWFLYQRRRRTPAKQHQTL